MGIWGNSHGDLGKLPWGFEETPMGIWVKGQVLLNHALP
jgi:hypothetical protein